MLSKATSFSWAKEARTRPQETDFSPGDRARGKGHTLWTRSYPERGRGPVTAENLQAGHGQGKLEDSHSSPERGLCRKET
jgi:hypothetical protein